MSYLFIKSDAGISFSFLNPSKQKAIPVNLKETVAVTSWPLQEGVTAEPPTPAATPPRDCSYPAGRAGCSVRLKRNLLYSGFCRTELWQGRPPLSELGGQQLMKMTCRPYQHLPFSKALRGQALCVSGTPTAQEGRAFVPCSSLALGNLAVSKNLSCGFIAPAWNTDTFSFWKVFLIYRVNAHFIF